MRRLLYFAAIYNLLAGFTMTVLYHEVYMTFGWTKPERMLFTQLVGILVALFGVGYWMVAREPVENRNVLLLGFLSKLLGSVLGLGYVASGKLSLLFFITLIFSDIVYLPFFAVILRRLYAIAAERRRWSDST